LSEYLRRRGSLSSIEYDIHECWVKVFDPASPTSLKNTLKEGLRENVEINADECIRGIQEDYLSDYKKSKHVRPPFIKFSSLPSGMTVAMVMCQGYRYHSIYASLKKDLIAERFVLIGYSTGRYDTSKVFSDGTSMARRVFITEEDLEIIRQNSKEPMLLVDRIVCSGLTLATIGNSLRGQLGYSGKLYQIEHDGYPMKWDGAVDTSNRIKSMFPTEAPILTECSKLLSEVKRTNS
jgi:hypothetical protein